MLVQTFFCFLQICSAIILCYSIVPCFKVLYRVFSCTVQICNSTIIAILHGYSNTVITRREAGR